jgi:hypothetical protein
MNQPSEIDLSDLERLLDQAIADYLAAEDAGHPLGRDEKVRLLPAYKLLIAR